MDILIEELHESLWVAALKDGKLEDLEVDPILEEVRWGSIYWAKVARIDKSMDAAYVNLDGDNIGLLHNADTLIPVPLPNTSDESEDGKSSKKKTQTYKKGGDTGIGRTVHPGEMIIVQAKSGYIPHEDDDYILEEDKSPRLSMDITLPGRYLIYSPYMTGNRISMRIRDKKLRKQLNKMLDSIENIQGCILRAAAADTQTDILIREANILKTMWEKMQAYMVGDSPQLITIGPDAVQRTMSDQATQSIDNIDVIVMDHYELIEDWCEIYAPDLVTKITPLELEDPHADLSLFDHHDIIGQIESLFDPYVILSDGSNIIIEETAALTAIDINRGSDTASNLSINLEAVKEIGRQIRLRNLAGIIVVDFLKLKTKKEQGQLIAALEDIVTEDPCTLQLHGMTNLGLAEMTRKRRTPSLIEHMESALANAEYGDYEY